MRSFPISRTRLVVAAVAAGLAATLAACQTDPYATGAADEAAAGSDGDLLVIGPVDGDTVKAPFEVAVSTSVELGPAEDGLHHIEIWFGEKREKTLTTHFADTTTVEKAPKGETTMWVQLADAEQQPVGEPISLALTVEPAGGEEGGNDDTGGEDSAGEEDSAGDDAGGGDSGGEDTGGEDTGGDGYGDGY